MSTKFEDFDPNKPDTNVRLWAVYDGYKLTYHQSRAPALVRFLRQRRAKLYQYDVNARLWVERAVKDTHPPFCDLCGGPTPAPGYYNRNWCWKRVNKKIVDPPELLYVCTECRNAHAL